MTGTRRHTNSEPAVRTGRTDDDATYILEVCAMPLHLIVVEKLKDFRWADPGGRVVTVEDYVGQQRTGSELRARVVNLCRDFGYLSLGYYCSLLAEARGARVVPRVRTILDLDRRTSYQGRLGELERLLATVPDLPRAVAAFDLHVYFGEVAEPALTELGRTVFDLFDCPLLRLEVERHEGAWRIAAIRPISVRDVPSDHDAFFLTALETYTKRRWHRPRLPTTARYDLAVLVDPNDKMPPSKPATLRHLAALGPSVGVQVELIERKDLPRLTQFDALFIRETTAVDHHTFRFALRAEQEGLPVIDDPASILRCANKVFLAELLQRHRVPIPATRVLMKQQIDVVAGQLPYPTVVKIPDGSFSRGVSRVADADELRRIAGGMLKRSAVILIQEYLPTKFDWRIGILDGKPLFAARYHMAAGHWQIVKHNHGGGYEEGVTQAVPLAGVPSDVLNSAVAAGRLVGRGLYGVDVKVTARGALVIEVNDNPNLDHGLEDKAAGDDVLLSLLRRFVTLIEARHGAPEQAAAA